MMVKPRKKLSTEEKNLQKTRVANIHAELLESIFKKIPILKGEKVVYLGQMYFEMLTDEEFVVLWSLPNLVIRVNPRAADYIEERRRLLGLRMTSMSGVLRGKEEEN